jgi:exosortase D (VPLPA-CTERM-specific)
MGFERCAVELERSNEMSIAAMEGSGPWKSSPLAIGLWAAVGVLLAIIFRDGLRFMVEWWYFKEEYSHGFLIPPVVAFLIWEKRDKVEFTEFRGSWLGVALVAIGLCCYLLGELSTIYTIVQYAFVVVLCGLVLAGTGWQAYQLLWTPLALLFLMIPLPNFFYHNLSAALQLFSSYIGVQFIRLFDISVLLSGNVIDLGSFRLQVVEACSGLRYLFPLVTLGIIAANFFKAAWWKRLLLVVSTVPIAVLMNSLRIGVIGITVEYWGRDLAEGLLHDFEGWAVFMCCFAVLMGEMWLLNVLGSSRRPFREAFAIDYPAASPKAVKVRQPVASGPLQCSVVLLVLALIPALLLPKRVEAIPKRTAFSEFPLSVGAWRGSGRASGSELCRRVETHRLSVGQLSEWSR